MKCTILGCGGSSGVPEIGCNCYVCCSSDIKNKRLRSSIYIESKTHSLLVDTSPDLRQQALTHDITKVDAILYTHAHSDHCLGIDDTKNLNAGKKYIPIFADQNTAAQLSSMFPYIFNQLTPWHPKRMEINILEPEFLVGDIKINVFKQIHGKIESMGFRFNELAYSTDFNYLDEQAIESLRGVRIWIIDCLKYSWAPTHSDIDKCLSLIKIVKPELAILTHMSHTIEYNEMKKLLPKNVIPAFDGMTVEFNKG